MVYMEHHHNQQNVSFIFGGLPKIAHVNKNKCMCVYLYIYIYTGIIHTLAALAGCLTSISQGGILVISVQGASGRQLITQ